jgi:hypothetical protein
MAKILKIIGIGVVAVGLLGAAFLVVSPIAAQTLDPIWPGGPHGGLRGPGDGEAHQEALAAALGISVDDLQSAIEDSTSYEELLSNLGVTQEEFDAAQQAAREAAIQQMVDDGTITQEQADRMLEGGFGPRDGDGFPGPHDGLRGPGDNEAHQEALATALGISVDDLQSAIDDSTSYEELLSNLGVTQEEFDAAQQTARETLIQQMVDDGTITQEQADRMLEGGFGPRNGDGFPGPFGGLRGFGDSEAHQEALATALGVSVEDLQSAIENSTSYEDLLSNLGVTQEEFNDAMQTVREAAIQQMVDDGTITQEQADRMLEGGFGLRDGDSFHGPHGGGFWNGDGTSDGTSGRGSNPFATTDDE